MQSIKWMAWTPATAIFFTAIALLLVVMTVLAIRSPEAERVGILGIATTRGDRLFISLIGSALIHLAWIGFFDTQPLVTLSAGGGMEISSLWLATMLSLAYAAVVFRTV
jgi:predicted small integral membrane protein